MFAHREPTHHIPIRTCHVAYPDGHHERTRTVYCAVQGHSLPLDLCTGCPAYHGVLPESEGNLVRCRGAAEPETRDPPGNTAIGDVMTTDVRCVSPDLGLDSLLAVLLDQNVSGVPVVDELGHPMGIVTKTDLLRAAREPEAESTLTVADLMTPLAFTLNERAPLAMAAALMGFEGVHRLPVVSDDGSVVGILSALDVTRWVARQDGYVIP